MAYKSTKSANTHYFFKNVSSNFDSTCWGDTPSVYDTYVDLRVRPGGLSSVCLQKAKLYARKI